MGQAIDKDQMRSKRRILIFVLVVAVLGGLGWVFVRGQEPAEPVYQGKKLSEWLDNYWIEGHGNIEEQQVLMQSTNAEVDKIVRKIGTNAIPPLLWMLKASEPSGFFELKRWFRDYFNPSYKITPAFVKNIHAVMAFRALGASASNAVPALVDIYDRDISESSRFSVLRALDGIHAPASAAVPLLTRELSRKDARSSRYETARLLESYGSDAKSAFPALLNVYHDQSDPLARTAAYMALQAIDPEAAEKAGVK
jgi:hypothetical protein